MGAQLDSETCGFATVIDVVRRASLPSSLPDRPAQQRSSACPPLSHLEHTEQMDFTVAFADNMTTSFTGDSTYEIHSFGVLIVIDETGRRLHLSPTGWLCVEDQEPKSAHARFSTEGSQ